MKSIGIHAAIRRLSLFIDEKEVQIDEVEALLIENRKDSVQPKSRVDGKSNSTTLKKNKRHRSPRDNNRENVPNKRISQYLISSQEGPVTSNSKGESHTSME